jgi:hypothetical protein
VGKTSVALAALGHCRGEHPAVTLQLDLADGARTPKQVISGIARQAAVLRGIASAKDHPSWKDADG